VSQLPREPTKYIKYPDTGATASPVGSGATVYRAATIVLESGAMRPYLAVFLTSFATATAVTAQSAPPRPGMAESPTIKVLTGLTVPEFEQEMQMMVQALGVNCVFCHVRNDFAAETNERKLDARRMLEMTKLINSQFFPDYAPPEGESKLGRVTCMTCHQGEQRPKAGS
jgi:hypothetical protein